MINHKANQRLRQIQTRGKQHRAAALGRADLDARTVELSFSSETDKVERWFGVEILGHSRGECNLERLVNGAPVLWDHNWSDQRGVVESARIDADGIGRAVVKFSRSAAGEQLFQDVLDGIVTKVSVGYTVEGLQLVEERDGVDVYRVTAWTPQEISMVSIPADDSVGVGRNALAQSDCLENFQTRGQSDAVPVRALTSPRPAMAGLASGPPETAVSALTALFGSARKAPGDIVHFNGNGDVRGTTPRRAAVVSHIDLRSEFPALDLASFRDHLPAGTQAGRVTTFDAALLASSAVLQSGVHLILWQDEAKPVANSGGLAFETNDVRFDLIKPAVWQHVDGEDLSGAPPSIISKPVDMTDAHSLGVRVELTRAEQRQFARDDEMASEILCSFALGLGRALDQQFLKSVVRYDPDQFSLAKIAASGFRANDARGIIGRNATGAAIEPAGGNLHVGGIPAEFSDTVAETTVLIGNRHAIAVDSEIRVICERTSIDGGLALTAWASVLPILGDTSALWKVAA